MTYQKRGNGEPIRLPAPTDDLEFFRSIKALTNEYWKDIDLVGSIYGFQFQRGTKWRSGLTSQELAAFEREMGYSFPTALKNFYLTMNGLDKPGINIYGNSGTPFAYRPVYYSYPDDLSLIKEIVHDIVEANNLSETDLPAAASRLFPVTGHRCLLIDDPKHRVLSMHYNDIIFWADGLGKTVARDIFYRITNEEDFGSEYDVDGISFWLGGEPI